MLPTPPLGPTLLTTALVLASPAHAGPGAPQSAPEALPAAQRLPVLEEARGELLVVCADRCPPLELPDHPASWRPLPLRTQQPRVHQRRVYGAVLPPDLTELAVRVRRVAWAAPAAEARETLSLVAAAVDQPDRWLVDPQTGQSWTGAEWATLLRDSPARLVRIETAHGRLRTVGLSALGHAELVAPRTDPAARQALRGAVQVVVSQGARAELPLYGCAGSGSATLARAERRPGDPPPPLLQVELPVDLDCPGTAPTEATLAQLQAAAAGRLHDTLHDRFTSGDGELLVKLPFTTRSPTPEDQALGAPTVLEWLWVRVERWESDLLTGTLMSTAVEEPELAPGVEVTGEAALVFDYLWRPTGGTWEGNRTAPALPASAWDSARD